jgi:outer membrane protein
MLKTKKYRMQIMIFRTPLTLVISFIVLILTGQAYGAVEAEQELTLEQAVLIALKNNPSFNQQLNAVESAQISVAQQRADFYPNLNASANATDSAQDDFTLSTEFSSTLNLFNGYADAAELESAKLELAAVQQTLTREQQTLVYETFSGFVQVLTDQALIKVREENLKENQNLLEQIETFQQAGRLALSDLYQQQAETQQAQLDLLQAQQTLNSSKLLLMQTLGLPPTIEYRVATPDFERLSLALGDENIESLKARTLSTRADVIAQQHQIEAVTQQIRQVRAGLLPKVDLFAKLASGYESSESGGFGEQLIDDELDATIGISFSIALFDRFETRNNIAKAKIEQRNELLALQEKQLQIGLEIEQAFQSLKTTQKQLEVVASQLISARQSLESYAERYKVGASTLLELNQARTDYTTAAYDQIEAQHNLVVQQMALAYSLGTLDPLFAALNVENN